MELPGAIGVWRRMLETHAGLVDALETRFRADHGLTATEFDVLVNIPSTTTIRHRELLDEIVLSRSALSRLLRRLETRGLVCQSADSADQRGVCVVLTPEGLRLKRDSARTNADVVRVAFSALTEDNLGELLRLIDRIHPQPTEPIEQ